MKRRRILAGCESVVPLSVECGSEITCCDYEEEECFAVGAIFTRLKNSKRAILLSNWQCHRGKTLELQSLELRYCTQLIAITLLNSFQFPIILGYDSIGLYLPLLMLMLVLHVSAALQLGSGRRPDEVQFGLSASSTSTST